METIAWQRSEQAREVAGEIWRYLTAAVIEDEHVALEAAKVLDLSPRDLRAIAEVQFLLSSEVAGLLASMPRLMRRLATTTVLEREVSAERVRGAIEWGSTLTERAAAGLPNLYVTRPARRAFQTPENEVLIAALDAVRSAATATGFLQSPGKGIGATIRAVDRDASRWLRTRTLSEIERVPVSARTRARVKAGRASRRYGPALDVFDLHRRFLRQGDRAAVRRAVEEHALLVATEDKLLELKTLFAFEDALTAMGFELGRPGLIRGGEVFEAARDGLTVRVYYQSAPKQFRQLPSRYTEVQRAHDFTQAGGLIPDLFLEIEASAGERRWVLVEVKGVESRVQDHARRAIKDLLAYRRAFDAALGGQAGAYGIAVAWGKGVRPSADAEIVVCSPDTVKGAIAALLQE